jgi:hypothetical protein
MASRKGKTKRSTRRGHVTVQIQMGPRLRICVARQGTVHMYERIFRTTSCQSRATVPCRPGLGQVSG